MLLRWSTTDVPSRDAIDYWGSLMREHIFKSPISLEHADDFRAELAMGSWGPLRVAWIDSPAQAVILPGGGDHEYAHDGLRLSLMHSSEWSIVQQDSALRVAAGDMVLADLHRPFELRRQSPSLTTSLALPAAWLHTWVARIDLDRPWLIRGDSGWGCVLSALLRQLSPARIERGGTQAHALGEDFGRMLALSLVEQYRELEAQVDASARPRHAQRCIERRFPEFGLCAADVAADLGVSERTVHRLFAREGRTFAASLNEQRIHAAARMLHDPAFAQLSVGEIGRRVGFSDASHFIRRCKSVAGLTPAAMRRQSARAAAVGCGVGGSPMCAVAARACACSRAC